MASDKTYMDNLDSGDITTMDKEKKVLKFEESNQSNTGKDINKKITSLDTDLEQLRGELVLINKSVEEGLDRLGDTDTDLTAKVSETYKRLGEIDNAYKALIEISSRIDTDIQKINGDVSTVAVQSATGLKNLEKSSIEQSHEFTQKNQKIVSKVNQLVENSKLTTELLGHKIQSATDSMMLIEKNVVSEIERLSDDSKKTAETIQGSVESNKAKIIKLQSVDEAIIRRATTLEISSAELTVKSQNIESSIDELEQNTKSLATGLEVLEGRTNSLELLAEKHGTFIGGLQKTTIDIAESVKALAGREQRRFSLLTSSFVLLLIAIAVIYFSQQNQFSLSDMNIAERSDKVDNQIVNIQQAQTSNKALTDGSISQLETKVEELNITLQDEIKTKVAFVEAKMTTLDDQVQSVQGRFNQSSPFSNIGDDNVIHSESWIANMPAENYVVQLAFVDNKDVLYEVAQSYNFYLKDSLSQFSVNENGKEKYVLLSGNYATQQQAKRAVADMPRYIDMQRPIVRKVDEVQKFISNK